MATIDLANATDLEQELQWFRQVLDTRVRLYFGQESPHHDILEIPPPDLSDSSSNWAKLVQQHEMTQEERLTLLLALVPHLAPRTLDIFFVKNAQFDRPYTEFGGRSDPHHPGFLPTGETLLFLLAGSDLSLRFRVSQFLHPDHFFTRHALLSLEQIQPNEGVMNRVLRVSPEYLAHLTHGLPYQAVFGLDFPAEAITTSLEWSDLVLNGQTRRQIKEIESWIEHSDTLLHDWGMQGMIRPGYRVLFRGRPGTGKRTTASLLGKATHREVYRIDLSMIVSNYIGETEKNLARVFQRAEDKRWILFFDEADALLGRRTKTQSTHDRFARQGLAYLLQRIEHFPGLVILSAHSTDPVDEAVTRRFETIIHFPMPSVEERLMIWQKGISAKAELAPDVNLEQIAQVAELSGGSILNVIRYASLEALRNESTMLNLKVIQQGIKREMVKAGKVS